jgi:uncharacterized membrane protein YdbT with pleckstrin-like domain
MSYLDKVLQPGEQIRISSKLHWICYARAMLIGISGLLMLIFYAGNASAQNTILIFLPIAAFILSLSSFLRAWWRRYTTEITITDKRVIYKRGWISRHTEEMNISKVETVDVDQSIIGRLFGYGTIRIRGVGSSWEPLYYIESPLKLRNMITVG